jgi:hypothetical protein
MAASAFAVGESDACEAADAQATPGADSCHA